MKGWELRPVQLMFRLGELTIAKRTLLMQVKAIGLRDEVSLAEERVLPPADEIDFGSRGFLLRGQPIKAIQPTLLISGSFICYALQQYQHYYIELCGSFETYKAKFSSKTRSTINRKIKRYLTQCGDVADCRMYSQPAQMPEFFRYARAVSARSYQERLLDAGLPTDDAFLREMVSFAEQGDVRGYVLFHGTRPVSYLYCPVRDGVLLYAYLGYDSDYQNLSVGTVLQWFALEHIFNEQRFKFFDFSEGQGEHKRLFATHSRLEANIMFLSRSWTSLALVRTHLLFDRFARMLGALLTNVGLKSRVRRLLRLRFRAPAKG